VNFDDAAALRKLCEPPRDPSDEPEVAFPFGWYKQFLDEIMRLGVEVVTYRDLFRTSGDRDYRSNFPAEYQQWPKTRDRGVRYLLIQHDVDNHPDFTKRMVAMEALYGIRSNVFLFCRRWTSSDPDAPYDVDHAFFQEAERHGFVIGYHQNALALAGFDLDGAVERFRADVSELRKLYNIEFVVPHGGAGLEVNGKTLHNVDVPVPPELEGNLRWVYNRYGVRFQSKCRDLKRLQSLDIIRSFLHMLQPGTRNFCLVHPQRWGFNVDRNQNPLLAQQPWYEEICARYAVTNGAAAH
jgi:hypothetical protein